MNGALADTGGGRFARLRLVATLSGPVLREPPLPTRGHVDLDDASRAVAATPAREAPLLAAAAGGGSAGEFFNAMGADWRLTATQQARLTPAVAAAVDAGLTAPALAAFATVNTAAALAAIPAAVVRGMRPNHPDARFRRRRDAECPVLRPFWQQKATVFQGRYYS